MAAARAAVVWPYDVNVGKIAEIYGMAIPLWYPRANWQWAFAWTMANSDSMNASLAQPSASHSGSRQIGAIKLGAEKISLIQVAKNVFFVRFQIPFAHRSVTVVLRNKIGIIQI